MNTKTEPKNDFIARLKESVRKYKEKQNKK